MTDLSGQHKDALDKLLLELPGVTAGKMFGQPAYKADGKVFAFVTGSGVVVKLPAERVEGLIAKQKDTMHSYTAANGIVWKTWVSIDRADSKEYKKDLPLLKESIEFAKA